MSVDGGWSSWSKWTFTESSCFPCHPFQQDLCGNAVRARSCNNPEPKDGGSPCYGDEEKTKTVSYYTLANLNDVATDLCIPDEFPEIGEVKLI